MSAQDRLPPDLLSKIFVTAFNATRYLHYPTRLDQIPWTVSRVSSRWRMVARSQHTLWNRITLNMFFKGKPASAEEALQFLQTAVHPSGPLHFDIMLGFRRGVNVGLFLIPYLGRLKGLRIDGSEYIVDVLTSIPPHSIGNLEVLELDINIHAIESPDIAGIFNRLEPVFKCAKNLRSLSVLDAGMCFFPVRSLPYSPSLPLSQLTTLKLSISKPFWKDFDHLVSILSQCNSLECLSLPPIGDDLRLRQAIRNNILPNLRSLETRTLCIFPLPLPWSTITSLKIEAHYDEYVVLEEKFARMIKLLRICQIMQALTLDFEYPEYPAVIDFHGALSSLQPVILAHVKKVAISKQATPIITGLRLPRLSEILTEIETEKDLCTLITCSQATPVVSELHYPKRRFRTMDNPDVHFRALLDILSSLTVLDVTTYLLESTILHDIGTGELLPHLYELKANIACPSDFVRMLERVEDRDGTLRIGHGWVPKNTNLGGNDILDFYDRLWRLSVSRCGNFRLMGV